jgi:hypothetical protein
MRKLIKTPYEYLFQEGLEWEDERAQSVRVIVHEDSPNVSNHF